MTTSYTFADCECQHCRYSNLRKATGGLPPELVAKRLACPHQVCHACFTDDELEAIDAATFEEPT